MSRYEIQIRDSVFYFHNEHDAKTAFEIVKFLKASGTLIETTQTVIAEHVSTTAKKTLDDYVVPYGFQNIWNNNPYFKHKQIYIKLIDGKFSDWTCDPRYFVLQSKENPNVSVIIYDVNKKEITT